MSEEAIEDVDASTDDGQETAPPPEAQEDDQAVERGHNGNREAAKYRRQLRDTEAERDAVVGRLEAAQRALIEGQLGNLNAAAFWKLHPDIVPLLDESGMPNPKKVTEAAAQVFTDLGLPGTFSNTRKGVRAPYDPTAGKVPSGELGPDAFARAFQPTQW